MPCTLPFRAFWLCLPHGTKVTCRQRPPDYPVGEGFWGVGLDPEMEAGGQAPGPQVHMPSAGLPGQPLGPSSLQRARRGGHAVGLPREWGRGFDLDPSHLPTRTQENT